MVTRKLGKKRGFLIACTTAGLAGLACIFFNTAVPSLWLSLASLFLLGVSMGMLNTMTWALEADTVEVREIRKAIESNRVLRHEQYHGGEKAPQAPTATTGDPCSNPWQQHERRSISPQDGCTDEIYEGELFPSRMIAALASAVARRPQRPVDRAEGAAVCPPNPIPTSST